MGNCGNNLLLLATFFREDTHKKVFFFSGHTTKGVDRLTPPPDRNVEKKGIKKNIKTRKYII